jgi:3,4-dihydroxy-2-butanone 4-phosphate synthase
MTRHDQRYQRAVKELEGRELVMITDTEDPSKKIIVGIARRGVGYVELACSKEKYDPFGLLAMFKRHTGDDETKYPQQNEETRTAYERAIAATAKPSNR